MNVRNWMSWEGGVDLAAATLPGLSVPNVILHVARVVHTPTSSAPAGMILWQPDMAGAPLVAGFISPDTQHGSYFGPKIFAGTPFEKAPVLGATITVQSAAPGQVSSRIQVANFLFEVTMSGFGEMESFNRPAGQPMPFLQQGVEAAAREVSLKVNGEKVAVHLGSVGPGGGAPAVWSPCGIFAR